MRIFPALLAILLAARSLSAGDPHERFCPEETLAFFTIEDAPRSWKTLRDGPLGALFRDPALRPFAEEIETGYRKFMEEGRREMGVDPEELLGLFQGQVSLALIVGEAEGGRRPPLRWLFLVEVGEKGERLRELVRKLEESDQGLKANRRVEEEFRETTIVTYYGVAKKAAEREEGERIRAAPPERDPEEVEWEEAVEEGCGEGASDPGSAPGRIQTSWCLTGTTFAASSDPDLLKEMLVRLGGDGKTLADSESFRAVRAQTGEHADVRAYCDVAKTLAMTVFFGPGGRFGMAPAITKALGAHTIRAAGIDLRQHEDALEFRAYLLAPGEKMGLLRVLGGRNSALEPPEFVPPDALGVNVLAIDLPDLWQEVRRSADRAQPGTSAMFDARLAQVKAATGVDVQADVIGSLGGQVCIYQLPPDPAAEKQEVPGVIVALDVANRAKLDAALATLLQDAAGRGMEESDYLGTKVRVFDLGFAIAPAMALLPNRLVFATRVEDLRALLASEGKETKSVRDLPEYARAVARLPASRNWVTFGNMAKELGTQSLFDAMLEELERPGGPLDLSKLPGAEILGKYVGATSGAGASDEEGILMVGWIELFPQEE